MTVRIGAKGQVVIPKSVRDLHPGDEVDFELRDNNEVVLVAAKRRAALGDPPCVVEDLRA